MPSNLELSECEIDRLKELLEKAGRAILRVRISGELRERNKGFEHGLVTDADVASNEILRAGLAEIIDLPIVSEESDKHSQHGETYWLVDPLDGTKEFVNGSNFFAVCVAVIHKGVPVFGMIHAPALDATTWSEKRERIELDRPVNLVLTSLSHLDPDSETYIDRNYRGFDRLAIGSAWKFAMVAKAEARAYVRLSPTHTWDVAAGDAILRALGGGLFTRDGRLLNYSDPYELIPGFVASTVKVSDKDLQKNSRARDDQGYA